LIPCPGIAERLYLRGCARAVALGKEHVVILLDDIAREVRARIDAPQVVVRFCFLCRRCLLCLNLCPPTVLFSVNRYGSSRLPGLDWRPKLLLEIT
jgi:ferredoxin